MPPERRDGRREPDRGAPDRRLDLEVFFESLGGSIIQSRATHQDIVERVAFEDNISTFRISTNTLGGGFVEAIANGTLLAIRDRQPVALRGTALEVPVLEAGQRVRIGRFGWKAQHASLESFSADAYLNEMGITTPLLPDENNRAASTSASDRATTRRRSRGRRRGRRGIRRLHARDQGAVAGGEGGEGGGEYFLRVGGGRGGGEEGRGEERGGEGGSERGSVS